MRGWVPLLIILLVLLVAGAALSWYFAYGVNEDPPRTATLAGLSGPVEIGWHEEGFAVVEAGSETDAYSALGYVHGAERAWTMLLWRQTALGRQAEWFGDDLLPMDGFARRLEINVLAQEAYRRLPAPEKTVLAAYATGVNAALRSRPVRLSPELALLEVEPEPWEPWHTLAVERLFAWLYSPPPSPDSLEGAGQEAQEFFASDGRLREWLHLHGFENGIAWAFADTQATHFFQRHVYGASALPVYSEVVLQWPGQSVSGATIPGTPFFPAGKTEQRTWSFLPRGTMRFEKVLPDSGRARPRYERLRSKDGSEQLITLTRSRASIYFAPPPRKSGPDTLTALADSLARDSLARDTTAFAPADSADRLRVIAQQIRRSLQLAADTTERPPDSTWAVLWSGFQPVSDAAGWRALVSGGEGGFGLVEPSGLAMSAQGQVTVIGTPLTVASLNRGVLVGNTRWTRYIAQDLDSLRALTDDPTDIARLTTDFRSEWASEIAPRMTAMVDSIPDRAPVIDEALTYLRNWDYAYDRSSIGAAIFDTWVDTYREETGMLPDSAVADTVFFENFRRYRTLALAVSKLQRRFGDDLSQWRWENVYPDRRYFPVWSADTVSVAGRGRYASSRFAPFDLPGRGHPSTLYWGPSPVQQRDRLSPASWSAWISTAAWDALMVRRTRLDVDRPLGRYRTSERVPPPVALTPQAEAEHRTTLTPPVALP